jgi:hypothetical protein
MERKWAMPSAWTFTIQPIGDLVREEMAAHPGLWIDPFAGMNSPAGVRNDINPDCPAEYHIEAEEFLSAFADESVDGVLYDPPYSPRQVSDHYKNLGLPVTAETTQCTFGGKCKEQIARILRPGGVVLCCGWNSVGLGYSRGFELKRVLMVCHGGNHYDTIVTVETKRQGRLVS